MRLMAKAIRKNREEDQKYNGSLTCVEPYWHKGLGKISEVKQVIKKEVQKMAIGEFLKLSKNDILFIDSSHVSKIGSDVNYLYLEVLPRLKQGLVIHIHDIYWPMEYPRELVLGRRRFWNEQFLVQALLTGNRNFAILWAGSYMKEYCDEELKRSFGSYKKLGALPGSLWIRRK